jgi:bifunctional non-homologous end joining protein LigD
VLAFAAPTAVRLVTRNGKDKARQFPEVTAALAALAARVGRPLVLDGEVVALGRAGYERFQAMQSRMHLKGDEDIAEHAKSTPTALVAFDLLADGDDLLIGEPWTVRRTLLERLLRGRVGEHLRLGETVPNDGARMVREARRRGWEGVIAKRTDAPYVPGARSRDWLKLKVEFRQELVVGGFTEPRRTRPYLGALLLGYYDRGRLVYAGHAGGGFTHAELKAMRERLDHLVTREGTSVQRDNHRARDARSAGDARSANDARSAGDARDPGVAARAAHATRGTRGTLGASDRHSARRNGGAPEAGASDYRRRGGAPAR